MKKTGHALVLLSLLLATSVVLGQSSTRYRLEESVINNGGFPSEGTLPLSSSFRITLDAVGESVVGRGLSSTSFHMDGCFLTAYPPPGEVMNLVLLADDQTLEWDPERSVGTYNLYRDALGTVSASNAGSCTQPDLADETTTDATAPTLGDGFFFLVTAANRLGEEGTRGFRSSTDERVDTGACP